MTNQSEFLLNHQIGEKNEATPLIPLLLVFPIISEDKFPVQQPCNVEEYMHTHTH